MFNLESGSKLSIYEQIYHNFVQLITVGSLKENQKIPSVRELALELRINPNTIQKAYKLLLKDNYIYSKPGSGNYVSEKEKYTNNYLKGIKKELQENIVTLRNQQLSKDEVINLVVTYYEEG